jgi:predicted transcriptional regulator
MTLLATDVMTTDVTTIGQDESVEALIQLFRVSEFTAVPVIDEAGRAVGLISETDILRALAYAINPPGSSDALDVASKDGRDRGATARLLRLEGLSTGRTVAQLVQRRVRELMTPVLQRCRADDTLAHVCETMAWKGVHRIIVTNDEGEAVGVISALDAVRRLGQLLKEQD